MVGAEHVKHRDSCILRIMSQEISEIFLYFSVYEIYLLRAFPASCWQDKTLTLQAAVQSPQAPSSYPSASKPQPYHTDSLAGYLAWWTEWPSKMSTP